MKLNKPYNFKLKGRAREMIRLLVGWLVSLIILTVNWEKIGREIRGQNDK